MRFRLQATVGSALAIIALSLSLSIPTSAHASTANATASHPAGSGLAETEMYITGFNAAVAKAHGYEILKNSQGEEYSVKIGSKISSGDPVITGNCGDSYIYYAAIGYRSASPHYGASTTTGYDVTNDVDYGYWSAIYSDSAGTGTVSNYSATNGTPYWSSSYDTWHSVTGYSLGTVSEASYVILVNGAICYSAGPWESTTLYK